MSEQGHYSPRHEGRSVDVPPPHNPQAESSLLGCILLDNETMNHVLDVIDVDDFYLGVNRMIFAAMKQRFAEGELIDAATIFPLLENPRLLEDVDGIHYLLRLPNQVANSKHATEYAQIIHDHATLRRVIEISMQSIATANEPVERVSDFVESINEQIFALSMDEARAPYYSMREIITERYKHLEMLYEQKQPFQGVPSGFIDLDQKTAGFQGGDLVILAARPSMGKTALSLNFLANAALDAGVPSAFFSLEMTKEQLLMRLLCSRGRVDASRLFRGEITDDEWVKITAAVGLLLEAPIYIDDTPALLITKLQAKARRLHAEKNVGLIVVDYLQLLNASGQHYSREQAISEISRSLKALAKELNIPVIALSQLNRGVDSRADKRPMLSDLRESGAIEQDADVILFIYRDEVYNKETPEPGVAEVILAKQRNGPIGTVKLKWFGQHVLFESLALDGDNYAGF